MDLKFFLTRLILLSAVNVLTVDSGEFLLLVPFGSHSHKNLFFPVAEGLGSKGHHAVLASIFDPKKHAPNVTEVVLTDLKPHFEKIRYYTIMEGIEGSTSEIAQGFVDSCSAICDAFFTSPPVIEWTRRIKPFDVVIVDGVLSECLFPFAHLVGKSVVAFNTAALFPWIASALGVPSPHSFVPFPLLPYKTEMSFFERMDSAYNMESWAMIEKFIVYPQIDEIVKKYFPKAKSVSDAMRQSSFALVNADPVLANMRPLVVNVANIGGIQCRPANSLPKELEDFASSSGDDGFIIFSLGSIFTDSFMTERKKLNFFEAFTRLKVKVIWKYDDDLKGLPQNVKVVKWFPQQDLLGHRKCRSFITHSGLLSMQESLYHGVPMVSIPLFADQPGNAVLAADLGLSVVLDWNSFTADDVVNAVRKTLQPDFQSTVKKYSAIFKDRPETAIETAVFWMEHLMRYPEGHHLKSEGHKLNFFQFFLVDIALVFILFGITIVWVIWISIRFSSKKIR